MKVGGAGHGRAHVAKQVWQSTGAGAGVGASCAPAMHSIAVDRLAIRQTPDVFRAGLREYAGHNSGRQMISPHMRNIAKSVARGFENMPAQMIRPWNESGGLADAALRQAKGEKGALWDAMRNISQERMQNRPSPNIPTQVGGNLVTRTSKKLKDGAGLSIGQSIGGFAKSIPKPDSPGAIIRTPISGWRSFKG